MEKGSGSVKNRYISQPVKLLWAMRSAIGKTAVILPSAFMVEIAIGMASLGLIFYMRDVQGLKPAGVGWFAAVWMMCYVCGCLSLHPVMARILPRYGMIAATLLMGSCIAGILLSGSVVLSFVFYGIFGLGMSFFWPPLMGWVSFDVEGTELGKALSRLTSFSSIGVILSPFLAGTLSDFSPYLPLYCSVSLFVITACLLAGASLALPRIRGDSQREKVEAAENGERDEHGGEHGENDLNEASGNKNNQGTLLRYPAWIGLFGTYTVFGVILNIFPMYARSELGISKSAIGTLLLVRAIGAACGYFMAGRTSVWHFRPVPMITGLFLMAVDILLLPWARSMVQLAVLMIVFGLLHSMSFSYSFFHGVTGTSRRSRRMAIHEALLAAGIITGSTIGGMIYQNASLRAVSLFCAGLGVVVISAQVVLSVSAVRREGNRRAQPSP
ncbi:MAG TPA: MFS transporter [Spirochaetia bacterium]|nr:MFS transporter [Spirochaetia bacterium]